jgi:hypothetical protein
MATNTTPAIIERRMMSSPPFLRSLPPERFIGCVCRAALNGVSAAAGPQYTAGIQERKSHRKLIVPTDTAPYWEGGDWWFIETSGRKCRRLQAFASK